MFGGGAPVYHFKLRVQILLNVIFVLMLLKVSCVCTPEKGNFLVVCFLTCRLKDFEAVCVSDCLEFPIGILQSLSCSDFF